MKRKFTGARSNRFAGFLDPATVVLFAGLGGVCIGVEQAYVEAGHPDRYIDLAVNHWTTAVAVHEANHPMTEHLRADVWEVDPAKVLPGRKIAYLHASPDCTDFSKAKGSAPKRKHIRSLADVVLIWAGKRRPDVITLENVEEFRQWGPLLDNGQPDPARRGEEFQRWCRELRALGYTVDHRELRACDYGTPTTRKRLFVVARCDGKPIVWPEPTHGKFNRADGSGHVHDLQKPDGLSRVFRRPKVADTPGQTSPRCDSESALSKSGERSALSARGPDQPGPRRVGRSGDHRDVGLKPYRTAAECIDWAIPMLSIFATPEEAKAFGKQHGVGTPRRPLKPKTLARIAGGLDKFVLKAAKPFIVDIQNYGWNSNETRDPSQPMPTVTSGPKGGGFAVVDATVESFAEWFAKTKDLGGTWEEWCKLTGTDPVIEGQVVAPFTAGVGGRAGQSPETAVDRPMPKVTGKADRVVVAATLTTLNHAGPEHRGASPAEPLATVTGANDARAVVAAMMTKFRGDSKSIAADEPMPTITSGAGSARDAGAAHALGVSVAYLSHFYTSNSRGGEGDPRQPDKTVTSGGQHSAVTVALASPAGDPPTPIDRREIVAAFLATYYGKGGTTSPAEPMPTVVGRDRIQLVTVAIDGQTYVVTDIAMRMLTPRELATAQGFPMDYVIDRTSDGRSVTKADQVKLIGNSVCPQVARAIAKANVVDLRVFEDAIAGVTHSQSA